jgi:uncharacterized protein (TIGR02001 family)
MSLDRRSNNRTPSSISICGAHAAALLSLACAGVPACAQTSGSLTLVSEYAVRGISLGAGRPALQLRVDHDAPGGWYAGGFVSPATLALPGGNREQAELIVYGGRAERLPSGLSWDAGISRASFTRDSRYSYTEFHAGLALDQASVRLFLSPAYYGDERTAYLDLNAFHPLDDQLRLTFHAGALHIFGYSGKDGNRADLRVGLAATLGDCSLQLGLQTVLGGPDEGPPRARALVASAGIRF